MGLGNSGAWCATLEFCGIKEALPYGAKSGVATHRPMVLSKRSWLTRAQFRPDRKRFLRLLLRAACIYLLRSMTNQKSIRLLRRREVCNRVGLAPSSLFRAIAAGTFPRQIALTSRTSAWPEHEVDAAINARIAGQSTDEIRALVARLHAARQIGGAP
jgi:prophage regulatory protein